MATGGTVDLAAWIIDDTCLVITWQGAIIYMFKIPDYPRLNLHSDH